MDGLSIKVKTIDGVDKTFSLRPRIIVDFEQKYGKGLAKLIGEEQKLEHIYYLGWLALKSNGHIVKPFGPEFLDTLESVSLPEFLDTLESVSLDSNPNFESTETV